MMSIIDPVELSHVVTNLWTQKWDILKNVDNQTVLARIDLHYKDKIQIGRQANKQINK